MTTEKQVEAPTRKQVQGSMANLIAMGRFLKQREDRQTAKWAGRRIRRLEQENERLGKNFTKV